MIVGIIVAVIIVAVIITIIRGGYRVVEEGRLGVDEDYFICGFEGVYF